MSYLQDPGLVVLLNGGPWVVIFTLLASTQALFFALEHYALKEVKEQFFVTQARIVHFPVALNESLFVVPDVGVGLGKFNFILLQSILRESVRLQHICCIFLELLPHFDSLLTQIGLLAIKYF
jgi:hypothetical protein